MRNQEPSGLFMAFADDSEHLGIDGSSGLFAERSPPSVAGLGIEVRVLARRQLHQPELLAHPPPCDHLPSERGGLFDVAFGARGPCAVDDLLGRATSHHSDDPRTQIRFGIVVTFDVGPLVRHAERLPARDDRHAIDRVGARHHQTEDCVAALVIRDALLVGAAQEERPLGSEHDLLEGVQEVLLADLVLLAPGG